MLVADVNNARSATLFSRGELSVPAALRRKGLRRTVGSDSNKNVAATFLSLSPKSAAEQPLTREKRKLRLPTFCPSRRCREGATQLARSD